MKTIMKFSIYLIILGSLVTFNSCEKKDDIDDYDPPSPAQPEAPVADFNLPDTGPFVNFSCQFTNSSTGNITSYYWTFGSGEGTSSDKNPLYVYNSAGTKIVKLEVKGPGGTSYKSKSVYVGSKWKIKVTNNITNNGDQPSISVNSDGSNARYLPYNTYTYFYVDHFSYSTSVLYIWTSTTSGYYWRPYEVPGSVGQTKHIIESACNRSLTLQRVE